MGFDHWVAPKKEAPPKPVILLDGSTYMDPALRQRILDCSRLTREERQTIFKHFARMDSDRDFALAVRYRPGRLNIDRSFAWDETPQGEEYWSRLHSLIEGD